MSDVSMPTTRSRASNLSGPRGTQLEHQPAGPEVTPPPEEITDGTSHNPPRPQEELREPLRLTHIATLLITEPPDEITNGPQPRRRRSQEEGIVDPLLFEQSDDETVGQRPQAFQESLEQRRMDRLN